MRLLDPHLLEFHHLLPHAHLLRIMNHLGVQLLLGQARALGTCLGLSCEERVHQVLLIRVQHCDVHVNHIVILDTDFLQLFAIRPEHSLPVE